MSQRRITDDLDALLGVLPPSITQSVAEENDSDNLLEVILDLGRVPTARFVDREVVLTPTEVTHLDIDYVVERIGDFDADTRAGLERTLHRISAIRNRRGNIVGLTCRVGRAVYGTTDIVKDLIESGKSLLLLGRPGVGKTSLMLTMALRAAENHKVTAFFNLEMSAEQLVQRLVAQVSGIDAQRLRLGRMYSLRPGT